MRTATKTKHILTALAAGTLATLELLDELPTRGSIYRSMKRAKTDFDDLELQRFYSVLNRLKREGLVARKNAEHGTFWNITSKGLGKLRIIQENKTDYEPESDNRIKIIVFDIPEEKKRMRAWLREVLRVLGFKMLQKSVWTGKNKIPEDFLFDLRKKNLISFIHILEVTKSGTVKELA